MEKLVTTEKLSVGYDGRPIIEDIAVSLEKGEIVTLIGPNGAGKSTILKTISAQMKALVGEIKIEEINQEKLSRKEMAKKVAILHTKRVAPELMSCYEVVALGRYPYTNSLGMLTREDHEEIKKAMELVEVFELSDRLFTKLSDGQKQRILLARAICQKTDILILDEPTSYLDIKYKLTLFRILQQLTRKEKMGVLMSLHELDLAGRVSDKIICVAKNSIVAYGTPKEVLTAELIHEIYQIQDGSFRAESGVLELAPCVGKSRVFVIAGNGTGAFVYRGLQRKGIPFSTGILQENDVDYGVAKALGNKVISVNAFEPFTDEVYEEAKKELLSCEKVICTLHEFGTLNQKNKELLELAKKNNIPVTVEGR